MGTRSFCWDDNQNLQNRKTDQVNIDFLTIVWLGLKNFYFVCDHTASWLTSYDTSLFPDNWVVNGCVYDICSYKPLNIHCHLNVIPHAQLPTNGYYFFSVEIQFTVYIKRYIVDVFPSNNGSCMPTSHCVLRLTRGKDHRCKLRLMIETLIVLWCEIMKHLNFL